MKKIAERTSRAGLQKNRRRWTRIRAAGPRGMGCKNEALGFAGPKATNSNIGRKGLLGNLTRRNDLASQNRATISDGK